MSDRPADAPGPEPELRTVEVKYLARVEGEGAFHVRVRGGKVETSQLRIFEPPRFFEAFLRGRAATEAPDVTARICGICPVAYQMSAVHAVERALGIQVQGALRELRRLLYCGEWIESHALHAFMLHLPDFLGYPDAVAMARDHRALVEQALRIKKAGNALVRAVGGREIHPINVRVGGFYRAPAPGELQELIPALEEARELTRGALTFAASLPFPRQEGDWELVALRHPQEYPLNEGRIVSSAGVDVDNDGWEGAFAEEHVPWSHALQARVLGRGPYLTGPLARFALNFDRLPGEIQEAARAAGLQVPCRNPFQSLLVRLVEVLWACGEALRIVRAYAPPPAPAVAWTPRAGAGGAATEAPRGLLFHRYELDAAGKIVTARIVPPTSQNQGSIERDLVRVVEAGLELDQAALTARCELAIRNHDPCISCATHFLDLRVEREAP